MGSGEGSTMRNFTSEIDELFRHRIADSLNPKMWEKSNSISPSISVFKIFYTIWEMSENASYHRSGEEYRMEDART